MTLFTEHQYQQNTRKAQKTDIASLAKGRIRECRVKLQYGSVRLGETSDLRRGRGGRDGRWGTTPSLSSAATRYCIPQYSTLRDGYNIAYLVMYPSQNTASERIFFVAAVV